LTILHKLDKNILSLVLYIRNF